MLEITETCNSIWRYVALNARQSEVRESTLHILLQGNLNDYESKSLCTLYVLACAPYINCITAYKLDSNLRTYHGKKC